MTARKRERPSLDTLPLATKGATPAPASTSTASAPFEPTEVAPIASAKGKADDRVPIIIRVSPEDRRALKMISARDGRTVQDMVADAVADIIRRSA